MTPHTIQTRSRRTVALRIVALLLVSAALLPAVVTAAQPTTAMSPIDIVQALVAARNRQDVPGAMALLDPAFRHLTIRGTGVYHEETAAQFLQPPVSQGVLSNVQQTSATTVEADITLTGPTIPPVRHPFTLHATVTIKNGRILRLADRPSPQTARDLATLGPPPGAPAMMPNTSASGSNMGLWLVLLGVFGVLAGMVVRRAALLRH